MVIQVGESQILEWKMAEAVYGGVGRNLALLDLIEEFANGVSVQKEAFSRQLSAFSQRESRLAFVLGSFGRRQGLLVQIYRGWELLAMAANFCGHFPIRFFRLARFFQMGQEPSPQHGSRDPSLEIGVV
jgi:hypothetical protein